MRVADSTPIKSTDAQRDSFLTRDEFNEQVAELKAQIAAAVPDAGATETHDSHGDEWVGSDTVTVTNTTGQGPVNGRQCFRKLIMAFGYDVGPNVTSVAQVPDDILLSLRRVKAHYKVYYEYYSKTDHDNHVCAVPLAENSARIEVSPTSEFFEADRKKIVGVTSAEQFFNKSNMYACVSFFAGTDELPFGGDVEAARPGTRSSNTTRSPRAPSIADDRAASGQANVAGGVKRSKRRVVSNKSKFSPTGHVAKSYVSSSGLMFNNINEMFQDMVSREYAQEIIEAVFEEWGMPMDDPNALKYGEDLICAFFIATTASNKADFDFVFPIPTGNGEVEGDFGILSRVLSEKFGVTRRQFSRGIADDMKRYLKDPENTHLLPKLADRAGCDPQNAFLVFDGSTHCSGLTSAQLTFTKLLESRNLFEDDAMLSQGASQTLMEGIHGRVRSKVQR